MVSAAFRAKADIYVNNNMHHSLAAAKIPSHLLRSDGRCPDGLGMACTDTFYSYGGEMSW